MLASTFKVKTYHNVTLQPLYLIPAAVTAGERSNMIIFIAGPITGRINYKKYFYAAERKLKKMGHIVINPVILPSGLNNYMGICEAMIDQSDAIYFLNGWIDSIEANEVYLYAYSKNMPIFFEENTNDCESGCEKVKYWKHEALNNAAKLGEIRIKVEELNHASIVQT